MERGFKGIWIPAEIWLDDRLTALDKMKGGVLLRSSLKTIWSSISIHGGEAAWNKCSPMNKIKTGIDSLRRRRVGGGCWELAGLP